MIFQIFNVPYFVEHLRMAAIEQATLFKNNFETELVDARTLVEVIRKNKLIKRQPVTSLIHLFLIKKLCKNL